MAEYRQTQTDTWTDKWTDRQTDRQADRWKDGQTDIALEGAAEHGVLLLSISDLKMQEGTHNVKHTRSNCI